MLKFVDAPPPSSTYLLYGILFISDGPLCAWENRRWEQIRQMYRTSSTFRKSTEGMYSKTSLSRPTMGPTFSGRFREVVDLGS